MIKSLLYEFDRYYYTSAVFAVVLLLAATQIERCGVKQTLRQISWRKLPFYLFTSFVLFAALLGRRQIVAKPLKALLNNFWPLANQEIENILIFVPVSFFALIAYRPRRSMAAAAALSFALSLFIEVSQLISRHGYFQLSDLLFNTLGGAAGGVLYCAGRALLRLIRRPRRD